MKPSESVKNTLYITLGEPVAELLLDHAAGTGDGPSVTFEDIDQWCQEENIDLTSDQILVANHLIVSYFILLDSSQ